MAVENEWNRMVRDLPARVSFELHRRLLERHVRPGDRVLEIGAGPGRFTLALAELGARVVVTDLSAAQLEANRRHVEEADAVAAVEAWKLVDVRDVSVFADDEFDAVIAFGGPLSYCFEARVDALHSLLRVTRPGGAVLASVMSLLGTFRHALAGVAAAEEEFGTTANNAVLETGDLRLLGREGHVCQMFRSRQIPELVESAGGSCWRSRPRTGRRWATRTPWPCSRPIPNAGRISSSTRSLPATNPARSTGAPTSFSPRAQRFSDQTNTGRIDTGIERFGLRV